MISMWSGKTNRFAHASKNFLFKRMYGKFFLLSVFASGLLHILIIAGAPAVTHEIELPAETVMQLVELPPEVMIPAPPAPLPEPVIPETVLDEPVAYLEFPETVPPPPMPEVLPEFAGPLYRNLPQEFLPVPDAMPRYSYIPPKPNLPFHLARERVNATTVMEFDLTRDGKLNTGTSEVTVSSGYPELDELALQWASEIKMYPATCQGEPTEVRIAIPLRWVAR
jgi:outer membrane biosynthesis protein TonB